VLASVSPSRCLFSEKINIQSIIPKKANGMLRIKDFIKVHGLPDFASITHIFIT
jgi:hypothetical protein